MAEIVVCEVAGPSGETLTVSAISHTQLLVKTSGPHVELDTAQAAELLGALSGWLQGAIERGAQAMQEATVNRTLH